MASLASVWSWLIPDLSGKPALGDFILCFYIGAAFLVLRLSCDTLFIPVLAQLLQSLGKPNPQKLAVKVFDDAYTSLSSGLMLIWAWAVMLGGNGGCNPFNISPCMAGWPDIHSPRPDRIYWLCMWGFYTYEMYGTVLKRGTVLPAIMVVHHAATMVLMCMTYVNSLLRVGLMATALLDLSNPLLHAAKTLQHLDIAALEGVKGMLFNVFALVFFIARVVVPPFTLLKLCLVDARVLPAAGFYTLAGFTGFVYAMQLFWFYKIVRVALRGTKNE